MIKFPRLAGVLVLLVAVSEIAAGQTRSAAGAGKSQCNVTQAGVSSSSASCNTTLLNGQAISSAEASASARTASSSASMTTLPSQFEPSDGEEGEGGGEEEEQPTIDFGSAMAQTAIRRNISINGTLNGGDFLLYRFAVTSNFAMPTVESGLSLYSVIEYGLTLTATTNGSYAEYSRYREQLEMGPDEGGEEGGEEDPCGCEPDEYFENAFPFLDGSIFMLVGLDGVTNSLDYIFRTFANAFVFDLRDGVKSSSYIQVELAEAVLVDEEFNYRGSVVFSENGQGVLDISDTPEPGSIILVATGLLALAGAARRRKRKLATAA